MTPMENYRKNNVEMGLVYMNLIAPPNTREVVMNYAAQLRALHFLEVANDIVLTPALKALSEKRTPAIAHDMSTIAGWSKSAEVHIGEEKTVKVLEAYDSSMKAAADAKKLLQKADEDDVSDEKWSMLAARVTAQVYRHNAIRETLRLFALGQNPVFIL